MTAAQLAGLITAAAGLLSSLAAVIRGEATRRQLAAHRESMECATTGSTSRRPPPSTLS